MKYSQNLPKREYSTTIGNFNITDLTSYFTLENQNLDISQIETTKNSTLIELSGTVYSDVNSFWLFLFANEQINPFTLTKIDNLVEQQTYNSNDAINLINNLTTFDVVVPAGSLVYPRTNNSGGTYDFGSTGFFSLTGGFALVQSFNPFNKIFTSLTPYGGITFGLSQNLIILINGSTGYYSYNQVTDGYTSSISYVTKQAEAIAKIEYQDEVTLEVADVLLDDTPVIDKGSAPYIPSGISQSYSYSEVSNLEERKIKYYLPYSVGYLNLTKVIQNYSV